MRGGTVTRTGREGGGLAPCQCCMSRDTRESAAVHRDVLCLVIDGALVVPCLRSNIRADDTDGWAGAPIESAKSDRKASAGLSNYARRTTVMTAQTVRREDPSEIKLHCPNGSGWSFLKSDHTTRRGCLNHLILTLILS